MSEADTITPGRRRPVTVQSLREDLLTLGVQPGMVLVVHSSLSQLGWVCGGAPSVVLALEEALTPEGTLVMPTHSGDLSEPSYWQNPPIPEGWWQEVRETMPAFDPSLTPSRGMGAVPECFRKQEGVLRSIHPHYSFAAWGRHARRVVEGHQLAFGLGEMSPLARLYDLDAHILLLGVGHSSNTSLHLAEYRAKFPGRRVIRQAAPLLVEGKRSWVEFDELDLQAEDFEQIGADFDREVRQLSRGEAGQGDACLYRQRPLVDYAVHWMEMNRA